MLTSPSSDEEKRSPKSIEGHEESYDRAWSAAVPTTPDRAADVGRATSSRTSPCAGGRSARRSRQVAGRVRVSLRPHPGETLGLVGESGCGKSTTGRLHAAADPTRRRAVVFEGAATSPAPRRGSVSSVSGLQIVFQDPYASLNPRKTTERASAEALRVHPGMTGEGRRPSCRPARPRRPVARARRRYPHEFSGGQRQRIGIARALALEPKLIVLDEPVSALDVSIQAGVVNLLEELQDELGLTYLFIAHDLSVVRHISDRVA